MAGVYSELPSRGLHGIGDSFTVGVNACLPAAVTGYTIVARVSSGLQIVGGPNQAGAVDLNNWQGASSGDTQQVSHGYLYVGSTATYTGQSSPGQLLFQATIRVTTAQPGP